MKPERSRRRGLAQVAGLFAELGLAVIGLGLAVTAFGPTPSVEHAAHAEQKEPSAQAETASAGQQTASSSQPTASSEAVVAARPAASVAADDPAPQPPERTVVPSAESAQLPPSPATRPSPGPTAPPSADPPPVADTATAPPSPPATPAVAAAPPVVPPPTTAEAPDDHGGTPGLKPAKVLFGAVATPAPLTARAIGTYAKGCLAGGQALPVDGPAWQAMRLSRNRNWGHPRLIALVEKLAVDGKAKDGWPGLLVGDLAQPRGGPMLTGHASHQIGLDADIWLTPMPDRTLSRDEREKIEATSMLSEDGMAIARDHWTDGHLKIIRRAASYPEVERILVHPAIKQVLCTTADGDRHWLSKVRPYWGHHYHFHVRIGCPAGSSDCVPQKPVPGDDGCGKELEDWFKLLAKIKPEPLPLPIPAPPPVVAAKPPKEKPPTTLDQLPDACRVVLATGNPAAKADIDAAVAAATRATTKAASTKAAATKDGATKDSAAKSAAKAAVAGTVPPKPEKPAAVSEKKTVAP